jgi:hypothetical protein
VSVWAHERETLAHSSSFPAMVSTDFQIGWPSPGRRAGKGQIPSCPHGWSSPSDPHKSLRSQSQWGLLLHRYWKSSGNHSPNPPSGSYPAMEGGRIE